MDQINNGRRVHVIPGARMRWIVTTKFKPVRIDENPLIKIASPASMTLVLLKAVLNGV